MPICKEAGCSRPSAPDSEYCRICGQGYADVPKTLEGNTVLVQQIVRQKPQQSFGLLGKGFDPKVELSDSDAHPYQPAPGERSSKFGGIAGFFMGLMVVAAILIGLFVVIDTGGRSVTNITSAQQSSNSSASNTQIDPPPVRHSNDNPVSDRSQVKFRIRATPKGVSGMSTVCFLDIECNKVGSVWVEVEGMHDYYIKWRVKKLQWSVVNFEEIRVWSPVEIYFTGITMNEAGRNLITAKLYDSDDNLIDEEKLSVRVY